ncbi:hypothetical protein ACRV9Z_000898 [Escherichia coli]|nr:hypothetical protein [Escherichia coli]EET1272938.1 hypothetical protein [Escherichia coli]EFM3797020.1 hypothetical protein [Escherichia coli]EGJ9499802.1 hypothetical protein [Escherichia coli]EHW2873110.1 hypothetical protein [Escherichia coli]
MMQNRKWILSSLVMTFFGIPILTQFLAAVVAMLGVGLAGIIEVCNILITPTSYLLLNIFMLALGALMLFFSGRVWAGDSAPEKREIAVWRQCLFLVPGLLILVGWIIALHLADYQFHQMGSGWLADLMLPWLGVLLVSVVGGEYWWIVIIPVGAHISFSLGYGRPTRHPLTGTSGLRCRNSLLFILLMLGFVAGYQGYLYKQLNPGVGVRENIDTWAWRPDKLNNQLTPLRGKPQIQFTQNWPRLDGATAAYPIYASAFYALSVIPEDFHTREYLESSRYYATQMNADKNIKLLAINGIAPTAENIRNGKYPYIVDAFMITRENTTSETQKLLEWFLTPQGQSLVEDVGYVPMYKTLP